MTHYHVFGGMGEEEGMGGYLGAAESAEIAFELLPEEARWGQMAAMDEDGQLKPVARFFHQTLPQDRPDERLLVWGWETPGTMGGSALYTRSQRQRLAPEMPPDAIHLNYAGTAIGAFTRWVDMDE